ncbi:HlyU family transcriptional regulator [Stappia indica]|uniref:HlyU family transcriptional regulator n=1 Tax=Stappia indica TaxID=538381 RepID=UPI001CD805B7|nr:HlyU family transcriptional regulator [Stappia indica]MCA1299263.1 transcriptional regulator [Stappia indica]
MVFGKIFGGLFGGSGGDNKSAASPALASVEYKGFLITPKPQPNGPQWQVAGTISKDGEPGEPPREHQFIRADVMVTVEDAAEFSIRKARQIIDEQGERIFS